MVVGTELQLRPGEAHRGRCFGPAPDIGPARPAPGASLALGPGKVAPPPGVESAGGLERTGKVARKRLAEEKQKTAMTVDIKALTSRRTVVLWD